MTKHLPHRVWTAEEMAANRAATYREWAMADDETNWINDQANSAEVARAYADFATQRT